ncbi:hypothetical protein GV790_28860 [Nocardia cyriacigeorgica]|nr:hypothetical protein [Nocardia cyriacigeorgica]
MAEGIDGAVDSSVHAALIPEALAQRREDEVNKLLIHELRASMRALTSSAFAIDAFYGSVKERAGEHPQNALWRENGTARYKQVVETFHHHLKIRDNHSVKEARHRIKQLFQMRDWAVHARSEYQGPIYRPDIDAAVPWQYAAFRSENAVNAVAMTIDLMNSFVILLAGADSTLQEWKPRVEDLMGRVIEKYQASSLPPVSQVISET